MSQRAITDEGKVDRLLKSVIVLKEKNKALTKENRRLTRENVKAVSKVDKAVKSRKRAWSKVMGTEYMYGRELKNRYKIPTAIKRTRIQVNNTLLSLNLCVSHIFLDNTIRRMDINTKDLLMLFMCYRFEFVKVSILQRCFPHTMKIYDRPTTHLNRLCGRGYMERHGKSVYFITYEGTAFCDRMSNIVMRMVRKYGIGLKTDMSVKEREDIRHSVQPS